MNRITASFTLADWLQAVTDPDFTLRQEAASTLRAQYPLQALAPLCILLTDAHALVRVRAVKELGKLKDQGAVGPLIQALSDKNKYVYTQVFKVLGQLKNVSAIAPIAGFLTNPDEAIQLVAVSALGAFRHHNAITALLAHLPQASAPVQLSILSALGKQRDADTVPVLLSLLETSTDQSVQSEILKTLGKIGDETLIDRLVVFAANWSDQQMLAYNACLALGEIGGNRALGELLRLYRGAPQSKLADWIISVLIEIKKVKGKPREEAVELLLQVLNGQNTYAIDRAILALGKSFKDKRAIQPLLGLLPSASYFLQWSIARTLAKIGGSELLTGTCQLYRQTDDSQLRYRLIEIWTTTATVDATEREEIVQLLLQTLLDETLLDDQYNNLCQSAIQALGSTFRDERVVEPLLKLIKSTDILVSQYALIYLESFNDKRAIEPLFSLLEQYNDLGQRHENEFYVLRTLGTFKEPAVVDRLLVMLDAEVSDYDKRQSSLLSILGNMGDIRVVKPIQAFLANPYLTLKAQHALSDLAIATGRSVGEWI